MVDYPDFVTSIRVPFQMFEELNKKVEEKNYKSIAEAIRSYCHLGLWVERVKTQVKDPEFLRKIDDLKKGNALIEWSQTLSENEAMAIRDAINIELDLRFKQMKIIK